MVWSFCLGFFSNMFVRVGLGVLIFFDICGLFSVVWGVEEVIIRGFWDGKFGRLDFVLVWVFGVIVYGVFVFE